MSSVKGQGKGNNNAMKFKTSEERRALALRYDAHCSDGLSDECFEIDTQTLTRYVQDFPDDFVTIKKSREKRRLFWEKMGNAGALGKIPGFNSAAWIFNMKNRFNWRDKQELTGKDGEDMTFNLHIVADKEK